jgi:hypothetical protein
MRRKSSLMKTDNYKTSDEQCEEPQPPATSLRPMRQRNRAEITAQMNKLEHITLTALIKRFNRLILNGLNSKSLLK